MSKEAKILKLVEANKTLQEMIDSGVAKEVYIKLILTKNKHDWKKESWLTNLVVGIDLAKPGSETTIKATIEDGEITEIEEIPSEVDMDAEMKKAEAEAVETAKQNAIATAVAAVLAQFEKPEKSEVRVMKDKCHRHPDVDVKPGQNCDKCIESSLSMNKLINDREFVLPCPECGNQQRQSNGGTIKKFLKKGHYSCGNCKVSYNTTGESVPWGDKDASHFAKSFAKGLV
jgi:hypothetical protein